MFRVTTFKITIVSLFTLLLAAPTFGEIKTKQVPYTHDGVELQGYMGWDDAKEGKLPGVLVVHEWWGLNDYARKRAEKLAKMGYVAFALDMYGKGKVAEHPQQAGEWAGMIRQNIDSWRSRALKGVEMLKQHEKVDTNRIAAIGYCFGGAAVCQLAYAGADLRGVVSFHGSLPVASEEDAKRIKSKILICHGHADPFIPEERVVEFQNALEKAGKDFQFIAYANAVHSFTNPQAGHDPSTGAAYNPLQARRAWDHMKLFFREALH